METSRSQYEHEMIQTNGVKLHVVLAGDPEGTPVVLLHGFPEFWYGWRNQIPYLAQQGYRIIIPDQRGYNLSDKPSEVNAYNLNTLSDDIVGLMDVLGYESFYLAGHDLGAAVSWWVAYRYPEQLRKMVILNVPYPTILRKQLKSGNIEQLRRSWYIFFFQLPWIPENTLRSGNWNGFVRSLFNTSNPGSFTEEDIEHYRKAWSQPGAITAMLNWYRAMFRNREKRSGNGKKTGSSKLKITVPTLILWGEKDIALSKELGQKSVEICEDGQLVYFPDATHWLQHDKAHAVNRHLSDFLID